MNVAAAATRRRHDARLVAQAAAGVPQRLSVVQSAALRGNVPMIALLLAWLLLHSAQLSAAGGSFGACCCYCLDVWLQARNFRVHIAGYR